MKGQLTGMRGVYLVAAELSRLGFIASPTSRSAAAADVLATDQGCQRTYSVQVKTNAGNASFWLVGKQLAASPTHIYVLVNLRRQRPASDDPEYFVVPSTRLKEVTRYTRHTRSEFYSVYKKDVLEFREKWDEFGDPRAEPSPPEIESPT